MTISAQYDPEARAMYVRLRDATIARSVEVDEDFVVDLDSDSVAIGLEVLFPPITRERFDTIALDFGFADDADEAWVQIEASQPTLPIRSGMAVYVTVAYLSAGVPAVAGASSAMLDAEAHEYALAG